jgi:hypothetical protein
VLHDQGAILLPIDCASSVPVEAISSVCGTVQGDRHPKSLIRLLFGYRGRISRSQFWMAAALVITRLLLRCQTSSAEQVS